MISTPTRGMSRSRRALVLLAGFAVAAVGALAFAGGQAKANDPFTMDFSNGQVNLGFAFKGAEILPARSSIPGTVSNPNFNPALPVSADNPTTVVNPTGTPLFDYDSLNPADFSTPGVNGGTPVSFKPLGCGTPVTFGLYAALRVVDGNPVPPPAGLIQDPRPNAAVPGVLTNPLANGGPPAGAQYYRVLNRGAVVPEGETIGGITGPYPAENTLWTPLRVDALSGAPTTPGLKFEQNPTFCPNPSDGSATGTVSSTGEVTIQSDDFKMPVMIVPNPLDGSAVPITIESEGDAVTGQYDRSTGALNLSGPLEVRVLTGLATNPLGSYCAVRLPDRATGQDLDLTTSWSLPTSAGFNGTPFTSGTTLVEGLEGPGALTGTFNVANDSQSVGGADCSTVNSVSKGLGGIWLGADVDEPAPYPTCEELGKIGTFPNCEDPKATIGKVTVAGPGKTKKGKVATWKVTIPNTGNITATGVRVAASGRGLKVNTSAGSITAGGKKTVTVKAKLKRAGKFTATFKVTSGNAGSKTVKKTVTVK